MRPEVIDGAAALLHRHVVLFVAMAQPEVAAIARAIPENMEQMFRAAAAQEMASRRELLLARLRDQGAITLDTLPGQMTASVLNHYLAIKERAVL
jgi:aspartate/methionine/tyrosine aminotransferase